MIVCLNCEKEFAKYKTQDASAFPEMEKKAKEFDIPQPRVCEPCYDELSSKLYSNKTSSQSHLHPMFRAGASEEN